MARDNEIEYTEVRVDGEENNLPHQDKSVTVLTINSKPGVLRQIRAADREMAREFEMVLRGRSQTKIKVEAEDIHPPVLTVTAGKGFMVIVQDVTNEVPNFPQSEDEASGPENQAGVVVVQVDLQDHEGRRD